MRNPRSIILPMLILLMLIVCGCQAKEIILPTKTPSPGDNVLKHLNDWDFVEMDAFECPADYSNFIVGGETNAHIEIYKQQLQDLGLSVRWDCKKKLYKIVPNGESSSPICGCRT
jgi:hypothetical protein